MTRVRAINVRFLVGALSLAVMASACGSRTALETPCVVQLERERPAVVFLVHWVGGCQREISGSCRADELFGGRDRFEAVDHALAFTLPLLNDVAQLGAMPTQTLRLSDRVPESRDGGANPFCQTPDGLTVPVAEGSAEAVRRYFAREGWRGPDQPNGGGPVLPNLPTVERAMRAGTPCAPGLLVLVDSGHRGCAGWPDDSTVIDAARYEEIRDTFARLSREGIRTLVLGLRGAADPAQHATHAELRILDAEAEGGGLARDPTAEDPARFFDYDDHTSITRVLERTVVRPFHCRLYPTRPLDDDALELRTSSGERVARDPSRSNGWDLVRERGASHVELFGDACERAITVTESYHFAGGASRCGAD